MNYTKRFDELAQEAAQRSSLARAAGTRRSEFVAAGEAMTWARAATMLRQSAAASELEHAWLPDEDIIRAIRDAGAGPKEWRALAYESGPYDVTCVTVFTRAFVNRILAAATEPERGVNCSRWNSGSGSAVPETPSSKATGEDA